MLVAWCCPQGAACDNTTCFLGNSCSEPRGLLLTPLRFYVDNIESNWNHPEVCRGRKKLQWPRHVIQGEAEKHRGSGIVEWTLFQVSEQYLASLCPTSSWINRTFQLPLWEAHSLARGISKWNSYSRAEHQTKMTIEQVKNFSNWDLCLPDEMRIPDWQMSILGILERPLYHLKWSNISNTAFCPYCKPKTK